MFFRPAAVALVSSLLLLLGGAAPSAAQVVTVEVLLDLDDDAGTGCSLATADGLFSGVDQVARIEVDPTLATIHDVSIADCLASGTDTLGTAVSVPGAATPLGLALGNAGASVAEVVLPTVALAPLVGAGVRVGATGDALITTDGTPGGLPIRFGTAGVPIPSIGATALGLLAALLVGAGALLLVRRHPQASWVVVFCLVLGTASAVWAMIVTDGQPSDWLGPPDAVDTTGSADPLPDLEAFFGQIEEDATIALRVDAFFADDPASCPALPGVSCSTSAECLAATGGAGAWQCTAEGCCECAAGFSGANCDCQDGACDPTTCPDQDGSGRAACTCSGQCVCINGYGGPGCEIPPSACPDGCNWEQGSGTCGGPWQPTGSIEDPTCVCSADWESPATSCDCFVGDADCAPVTRTQVTCSMECACATGDEEWCGLCPGEVDPDGNFYLGGGSGPCPWP